MKTNPRKAAYWAVLATLQKGTFAANSLDEWRQTEKPAPQDLKFAREIAYGAIRMAAALDYIAEKASGKEKLTLKVREKALLRCGAYQLVFMDRTPGYAIVNECVKIAKELGNPRFPGLLNAILRKIADTPIPLPEGRTPQDLSIKYSYPQFVVEKFIEDHGLNNTEKILEIGNQPSAIQARKRKTLEMVDVEDFAAIANDTSYYIQNYTPAFLLDSLTAQIKAPEKILDLCSAPGGKLLAAHDKFPNAELFANELSKERAQNLMENIRKYSLHVSLSEGPGELYESPHKFDLIILDVPCSNSGVLNKRPEARWRLDSNSLKELKSTQLSLIENAVKCLNKNGSILYMTCSILKEENEDMVRHSSKLYGLNAQKEEIILPHDNLDGGYGALLQF